MRKPTEKERISCSECSQEFLPDKVWESHLPNGQRVAYGTVPDHAVIWGAPCLGSNLADAVTQKK